MSKNCDCSIKLWISKKPWISYSEIICAPKKRIKDDDRLARQKQAEKTELEIFEKQATKCKNNF